MCKAISLLCRLVHEKRGVRSDDAFIFTSSSHRLIKPLHAEDGDVVTHVKRLEAGRFKFPEYDSESDCYPIRQRHVAIT